MAPKSGGDNGDYDDDHAGMGGKHCHRNTNLDLSNIPLLDSNHRLDNCCNCSCCNNAVYSYCDNVSYSRIYRYVDDNYDDHSDDGHSDRDDRSKGRAYGDNDCYNYQDNFCNNYGVCQHSYGYCDKRYGFLPDRYEFCCLCHYYGCAHLNDAFERYYQIVIDLNGNYSNDLD